MYECRNFKPVQSPDLAKRFHLWHYAIPKEKQVPSMLEVENEGRRRRALETVFFVYPYRILR